MLKKIIDKYNFNVVGMLRNGTIAVVTMFGIAYLFGITFNWGIFGVYLGAIVGMNIGSLISFISLILMSITIS